MKRFFLSLAIFCCCAAVQAQSPITLNTSLAGFVPLTASPWVADVYGHIDPSTGQEYALVCLGNTGLAIIDITNPASATVVQTIPATASDLKDVRVYQNYAYAVQQGGEVLIIDITSPPTAQVVGSIPVSGGHNIYIDQDRALLYFSMSGASGSPMKIYDLSDPVNPLELFNYDPPGHNSHDAYASGNRAYSFDIQSHLTHVLDVSNPAAPVLLTTLAEGNHSGYSYFPPGGFSEVLVTCNEKSAGHVNIYDVTSGQNSNPISTYFTDPALSVHNAIVRGRFAYLSYYWDGLRILDLANPATPVEVGIYDPSPVNGSGLFVGAWGVFPISETKIILSEMFGNQGIYIIDFTPPPSTQVSCDATTSGMGDFHLTVSGLDPFAATYLPVSVQTNGLLGTGGFLGLGGDGLFYVQQPSEPFQAQADASGTYQFDLPAGLPVGHRVDLRAVSFKAAAGTFVTSELVRIEF